MTTLAAGVLDRLEPVTLADVVDGAALLDRRERKYALRHVELDAVLVAVGDDARVLEMEGRRRLAYRSVYLDTPELDSYLAAARGRPRRLKVRTRCYLDTGGCHLEVKRRDRDGRTRKERLAIDGHRAGALPPAGWDFLARFDELRPVLDRMRPTLTTVYRRVTLLLPCDASRVTIDLDLVCADRDGHALAPRDLVLVEVKSPGAATSFDRVLRVHGHRPITVSKYGTGMAALHPELPANRWHRVVRRWCETDASSWRAAGPAVSQRSPSRIAAGPEPPGRR